MASFLTDDVGRSDLHGDEGIMSEQMNNNRFYADSVVNQDDIDLGKSPCYGNLSSNDDTNTTTTNNNIVPPQKYTKEYIEDRIDTLRRKFQDEIPQGDSLDLYHVFSSIVQSLETAKQGLNVATKLLQDLQKAQTDGKDIDPKLLEQAQDAVQKAQGTVTEIRQAGTDAGCAVVVTNHLDDLPTLLVDEAELLECTVLVQGTPTGLAEWCQMGETVYDRNGSLNGKPMATRNEILLDEFLKDVKLMKEVLIANGPSKGQYGPMLEIHSRLRQEMAEASDTDVDPVSDSDYCNDGFLDLKDRLALAVALEHATPIVVFQTAVHVDPVARFWHYVHAYQKGELDESFSTMSTWELRLVVDCNAMDRDIQWGRDYLKSYRPDQIWTREDDRFRYIWSVRTDLGYRHPDHDYSNYMDLISAGGECGARAWFARFICKSFGIPTWGVRQPGHAALSRWLRTPEDGTGNSGEGLRVTWTTCLGAGWDSSTWDENRYCGPVGNVARNGLDFFEETQARNSAASCGSKSYYQLVTLLECLAECFGETVEEDYSPQKIWRSLSIAQRKMLAQSQGSLDPGKPDESDEQMSDFQVSEFFNEPAGDGNSSHDALAPIQIDGSCIVIPAASFVDPPNPTKTVMPMNSFYGGTQLHLEKDGAVSYQMPANLVEGTYALTCRLVNIHRFQQPLLVTVESEPWCTCLLDDDDFQMIRSSPQVLPVQYTMGRWQRTTSINVKLKPGDHLKLTRIPEPPAVWGLTIKELFLEQI